MNPYLEQPDLWPEVHHWLITGIAESLVAQLRPKYRVAVEKRVYQTAGQESVLVGIPDVVVGRSLTASISTPPAITAVAAPLLQPISVTVPMPEEMRESYLEVREVGTGEVITTIEILSPANKRSGEGRRVYESKRQRVLSSFTHLVEIDLLRSGESMLVVPLPGSEPNIHTSYRILVSRGDRRPSADLYRFNLADPIPAFPLPLQREDTEPLVELQRLVQDVYDRAGFDLAVDYNQEPVPPLSESEAVWIDELLRSAGLRHSP